MPDREGNNFVRLRRNLILISLFMIFYKVGDLDIKRINIFGNETTIGNSEIVFSSMVVFFLYSLWRYYTACRNIGGVNQFINASRLWVDEKCKKKVVRHILAIQDSYRDVYCTKRCWKELTFSYSIHEEYFETRSGAEVAAKRNVQKEMVFGFGIWHWRLFSFIHVIFSSLTFSEYIFPYLLAVLAVLEMLGVGIVTRIVDSFPLS